MSFHKFEKGKFEDFRDRLVERSSKFPRLRSCATKLFGRYMFYDMGADTMIKNSERLFSLKTGVHNEKQLAEFMAKE